MENLTSRRYKFIDNLKADNFLWKVSEYFVVRDKVLAAAAIACVFCMRWGIKRRRKTEPLGEAYPPKLKERPKHPTRKNRLFDKRRQCETCCDTM